MAVITPPPVCWECDVCQKKFLLQDNTHDKYTRFYRKVVDRHRTLVSYSQVTVKGVARHVDCAHYDFMICKECVKAVLLFALAQLEKEPDDVY